MDGISILMEGTTYGASFGTKILTETTGDRRSSIMSKLKKAIISDSLQADVAALDRMTNKLTGDKRKAAVAKMNEVAESLKSYGNASAETEAAALKTVYDFISNAEEAQAQIVETVKEAKKVVAEKKANGEDTKADEAKIAKVEEGVAESKAELSKFKKATGKMKELGTKTKDLAKSLIGKYKDLGNGAKIAEGVALVVAAYSIGYGILKTVSGVSVESFLSVKTNVSKMISVVSNPKTYGWAKAGAIILVALLTSYGIYRFGSAVTSLISKAFGKKGEAATSAE